MGHVMRRMVDVRIPRLSRLERGSTPLALDRGLHRTATETGLLSKYRSERGASLTVMQVYYRGLQQKYCTTTQLPIDCNNNSATTHYLDCTRSPDKGASVRNDDWLSLRQLQ